VGDQAARICAPLVISIHFKPNKQQLHKTCNKFCEVFVLIYYLITENHIVSWFEMHTEKLKLQFSPHTQKHINLINKG